MGYHYDVLDHSASGDDEEEKMEQGKDVMTDGGLSLAEAAAHACSEARASLPKV